MAILLSEAGLLHGSYLLGSDCRGDAIERARLGLYDASLLSLVPSAMRDRYFEPDGRFCRPVEALRRQVHWKVADLLAGVEDGPWDIIFWRNAAIYLNPLPAETIWRRLAAVLAPQGLLIAGKADRPPADAGLKAVGRCIYRVACDSCRERPPRRSVMDSMEALNTERHGGHSLQESLKIMQDPLALERFS
jgi:chemotaxis methyl-accepting protein methylase